MEVPSSFRRLWRRRTPEQIRYEGLFTNPVGGMLSTFLFLACKTCATKMTFGLPPGILLGELETREIVRLQQEDWEAFEKQLYDDNDRKLMQSESWKQSVVAHCRNGMREVPLWFWADGQWHRQRYGIPARMYPHMPGHAVERLVSLNATRKKEQPLKWIEYTKGRDSRQRFFVEVDLVVEENGSFTIELLGHREEPLNVRVSRYVSGY
ncbi:MAG: hypothetical protein K8T25_12785 [Planctomycetia bacterium]|nr:hypothetical protein [Planctomycetia bacterium]